MTHPKEWWGWLFRGEGKPILYVLAGAIIFGVASGRLGVPGWTVQEKQPTQEPIASESLRLLIQDTARKTAKETVKEYDEVWSQWRKSTEDRFSALERDRWVASRRRNTTDQ